VVAEAPAAHTELGIGLALLHRLAVPLSIEGAVLHDLAELGGPELLVAFAHRRGHRHAVGDRAHHQHGEAVHVEGERRGGIALRKLLRHEAVGFVVRPEPAVALGHAQAEEPLGAEIGIVVEGKGCGAVVAVGARDETLAGQTAGKGDQLALPGGRLKMHQGLTALATFAPISHLLRPDFKPGGLHLPWTLTLVAVWHKIDEGPCRPSRKAIK
jgi:hypothetical protein